MDMSTDAETDEQVDQDNAPPQDEPQPPTPPQTQSRNSASPPIADAEEPQEPAPPPRRQHHGYASIEVYQGAAQVIRWENVDDANGDGGDEQLRPEHILKQKEWFELAEWLSTLPISNTERARYFELERVSRLLPNDVNKLKVVN